MNLLKMLRGLAIASALAIMPAQAEIITFDSHPVDFGNPIIDSGFQFSLDASGWGVFGPGSGACCNVNYDGTPALFADGDRSGPATVTMTRVGGGTFVVSQLDASVYWTGASGQIELTGAIDGGGTVTSWLTVGTTWQTFLLSGFTNLDSLTFQDTTSGDFLVAPGIGIDNIYVNQGSAIPEPASLALVGLGLLGLGLARRRRA